VRVAVGCRGMQGLVGRHEISDPFIGIMMNL